MPTKSKTRARKAPKSRTASRRCAVSPGSASGISDAELNGMLHTVMLENELDELGAPKEQSGGKLSPFGRLRRIAPQLLADKRRLEWLIANGAYLSHSRDGEVCNVWLSQDPDDDSNGHVPAQGYPQKCYHDAREAIDAAMRGPNTAVSQPGPPL